MRAFAFLPPENTETRFDNFFASDILVDKSNITDLRGCAVHILCLPVGSVGRCVMDQQRQSLRQNADDLAQERQYKMEQMVIVVKPVFKEKGSDSLTSALIRLMRSDIDNP